MAHDTTAQVRNLEDFAGIASDWFWETDADHRFTYFSARMEEVTKIRPATMLGCRRDQQALVCREFSVFEQHLDDLAHRRPFRGFEYKIKRQTSDGYLWLRVSGDPVFDRDGVFMGYRGTGHDITPEKEALARLEEVNTALTVRNRELNALRRELELAAFEDPLTGLRNRRAFDAELEAALSTSDPRVSLLLIDLDRFKPVNDSMGHPAGDMVLNTAAERLNQRGGWFGEAFRIGGDEFAFLSERHLTRAETRDLADGFVAAISDTMLFRGQPIQVSASIGVAQTQGVPTTPRRLFAQADKALYAAKESGRNGAKIARLG